MAACRHIHIVILLNTMMEASFLNLAITSCMSYSINDGKVLSLSSMSDLDVSPRNLRILSTDFLISPSCNIDILLNFNCIFSFNPYRIKPLVMALLHAVLSYCLHVAYSKWSSQNKNTRKSLTYIHNNIRSDRIIFRQIGSPIASRLYLSFTSFTLSIICDIIHCLILIC